MRKGRKHPGGKHHGGTAQLFTQGATQALGPGGFASTFFSSLLICFLLFLTTVPLQGFAFFGRVKEKYLKFHFFLPLFKLRK